MDTGVHVSNKSNVSTEPAVSPLAQPIFTGKIYNISCLQSNPEIRVSKTISFEN